jgi:zinc transport system permease protein
MILFFHDLFQYNFLIFAVLGALLASIACGFVGTFVVAKRTTYVAGAIAHSVLGGMGAALYFRKVHHIQWLTPLVGASIAAILSALIISFVTASGKQRHDTVTSAVWAIGMAVGISFISMTPGYSQDLMSYLFGNILMIGMSDLWTMVVLDLLILIVIFLFYNKFLTISFQPELAKLRGVNVFFFHSLMMVMISLTVVLLTQVVGLIMVIALLTLPAATALKIVTRLPSAMILASLLCMFFSLIGIAVSYEPELPAGATIIEIAGAVYLITCLFQFLFVKYNKKIKNHS